MGLEFPVSPSYDHALINLHVLHYRIRSHDHVNVNAHVHVHDYPLYLEYYSCLPHINRVFYDHHDYDNYVYYDYVNGYVNGYVCDYHRAHDRVRDRVRASVSEQKYLQQTVRRRE